MTDDKFACSCTIPLTQGYVAIVDAVDYDWLMQWKWQVSKRKYLNYAERRTGRKTVLYMHREILIRHSDPDSRQADHINGNGLDNRLSNLRWATPSQNKANSSASSNSKSGIRGIHQDVRGKWIVQLTVNYKTHHIGTFSSVAEAIAARNTMIHELHGEFGRQERP